MHPQDWLNKFQENWVCIIMSFFLKGYGRQKIAIAGREIRQKEYTFLETAFLLHFRCAFYSLKDSYVVYK